MPDYVDASDHQPVHPEPERARGCLRDLPNQVKMHYFHSRTEMPRWAMCALAWPTVYVPSWKMLAANTASARPC